MRDRTKEQKKYYAKPEVKEYHRKWIRAYWKKIKSDSVAHAKWKAQSLKNSKAAYQRKKEQDKAEWKTMMSSEKSRLAMFVVLMQMVRGKTTLPLSEAENKTRVRGRDRKREIRSTPEGLQRQAEITKRHYEKSKINRREYQKYKYLTDDAFRLVNALRNRLLSALKASNTKKSDRSMNLFGCSTREELRAIIESKFKPGMCWKNYSTEWVVDHNRPCASYDLSLPEEQAKCFHHSNLCPEWKLENIKKSSKWNGRHWRYSDHQKDKNA